MAQNLISATLSADDAAAVQQSLADAKSRLSFLLSREADNMISLSKVGNAYLSFIEKAYQTMQAHPEIIPLVFKQDEFANDYQLLNALRPIFNQINELAKSIQKTFTAVGSDAMVALLEIYGAVKQNKDKVQGLLQQPTKWRCSSKKRKQKATT